MTVLITGAGGFLGRNVAPALAARGYSVRGLFRATPSAALRGACLEVAVGDIRDASAMGHALKGCDACVHAAAAVSLWPSHTATARQVTVGGTRTLLAAAAAAGVARVVHVGSASSFGFGSRSRPGTEQSPYRGRRYRLEYADYKYAAQVVATRYAAAGLPVVTVAPTFMLGAFDTHFGGSRLLLQVAGAPVVAGTSLVPCPPGGRNFVAVADAAEGVCNALERGVPGRSYILGHRNLRYRELVALMSQVLGRRATTVALPATLVRVAGALGSGIAAATGRAPALSTAMARAACDHHFYSAARAVTELGLPQTPIEHAIAAAWRWLQDGAR